MIRLPDGVTATAHSSSAITLPPGARLEDHLTHVRITRTQEENAMSTITLAEARELSGTDFYDYLDSSVEVPTITQAACQGDVSLLRVTKTPAATPVPAAGVVVATGQGGHHHTITGAAFFDRAPVRDGALLIGRLTVPADTTAVLISHQEHGALLISEGTWEIGGQREFAGEWRAVAD